GLISGTPTQVGQSIFTVQAADSSSPPQAATVPEVINIQASTATLPTLPQALVDKTFPDTTNYTTTTVAAGADLQAAINNAGCSPHGTVLRLASGARFIGHFPLPAKTCAAGQWIIIRTDVLDLSLPAPGVRIHPFF